MCTDSAEYMNKIEQAILYSKLFLILCLKTIAHILNLSKNTLNDKNGSLAVCIRWLRQECIYIITTYTEGNIYL